MAAAEMYDYLSVKSPDYAYTLDMEPHDTLVEDGSKRTHIKEYDDETETRLARSTQSVFYVTLHFKYLTEADAGTLFDLYHDSAKASEMQRSFRWLNYGEPAASRHTYVVRFASPLPKSVRPAGAYGITNIRLKVLGVIADT